MHEFIRYKLSQYACQQTRDYENALKEIIQEIALLGLWRAKFFEHAAFYGGSALRILYGLDRFSEDLDFTLLKPDENFKLEPYNKAVLLELKSFGFEMTVEKKEKTIDSTIESAFLKANTKLQLIAIQAPAGLIEQIHNMRTLKIKMEIDIDPPGQFVLDTKTILTPIPFTVTTLSKPDLLAGKIHAILCRAWKTRVKGRDWYDLYWYIARQIPVHMGHLTARLVQSQALTPNTVLTQTDLLKLLMDKIAQIDFEQAKQDVMPFIKDDASVHLWSREFFATLIEQLKVVHDGKKSI